MRRPGHAVILAGGQSRRMGQDKAGLLVDGVPLLQRTARCAAGAGLAVLVAGRGRPADWPADLDAAFIPDAVFGVGPLGGLLAALRAAQGTVLALACDLPLLQQAAVTWLLDQAAAAGPHGLVVVREAAAGEGDRGGSEPLFSIYSPLALSLIERQVTAGAYALRALVRAGEFAMVTAPTWLAPQLRNANTPAEWARAVAEGAC